MLFKRDWILMAHKARVIFIHANKYVQMALLTCLKAWLIQHVAKQMIVINKAANIETILNKLI